MNQLGDFILKARTKNLRDGRAGAWVEDSEVYPGDKIAIQGRKTTKIKWVDEVLWQGSKKALVVTRDIPTTRKGDYL